METVVEGLWARRRAALVVGAVATLTVSVAVAVAAPGSLTFTQSFNSFQLNNTSDTVVSPDGKHVYTTAFAAGQGSVTAAARNPETGVLTFIADDLEVDPNVDGIGGAEAIAISPEGANVYVAGFNTDSIARFDRNANNGVLNFVESYYDGQGGVTNLGGPMDVAVSPDGLSVYAVGHDEDALNHFSRNPATGALAFVGAEIDGLNGVTGLNEVRGVAVPPDGENVYTISDQDSDVTTFTRFAGTGVIDFLETDSNNPASLGARELAISPDNANVYVAADAGNAVSEWDRNQATGALTLGTVLLDNVATPDLAEPAGVQVAPDGNQVYVTSDGDNALLTLDRAAGGAISFRAVAKDGQAGVTALGGAEGLSLSADGRSLYVAASTDDRVGVFSRELPVAPPPQPPVEALGLSVSAKKKQKAKKLAVVATCTIACEISAKAKGKAGEAKLSSKAAKASLAADVATNVRLKFSKGALKKAAGEKGKATITVVATAGAETQTQTAKVKLTG